MARFVNKPISTSMGHVKGWAGLAPAAFVLLRERHQVVEVLDCFRMLWNPWWEDPQAATAGPEEADVWRVRTVKQGVFELVQLGQSWWCYKAYD